MNKQWTNKQTNKQTKRQIVPLVIQKVNLAYSSVVSLCVAVSSGPADLVARNADRLGTTSAAATTATTAALNTPVNDVDSIIVRPLMSRHRPAVNANR